MYTKRIYSILAFTTLSVLISYSIADNNGNLIVETPKKEITFGSCIWVIGRKCPDNDIEFYLFTRKNPNNRQYIHIDNTWEKSNLSSSYFNPYHPVKIIIHGYNSDMFLHPLVQMKDEYLQRGNYNLIYIEWSKLSQGPCYISAVHNCKHVGICIAQLIERILEAGTANIHLIGFSLGAQVTNFVANGIQSFVIPRITGLDPALPLFVGVSNDDKLDPSDAAFVDIIHTNALIQGKIERCGHVDFYMNGGIIQPGCFGKSENPFACSHHRAPDYYAESIRSYKGFWGWQCSSYINYLLGLCPPTNYLVLAGEDCNPETEGMYLIVTNSQSPFALGKWTDNNDNKLQNKPIITSPFTKINLSSKDIDQWGKLDSNFNNIMNFPTPYSQDPNNGENYLYFGQQGINEITNLEIENTTEKYQIQLTNNKTKIDNFKLDINNNEPQILNQTRKKFIEDYKKNLMKNILKSNTFQFSAEDLDKK